MLGRLLIGTGTPVNGVYLEFINTVAPPTVNPDPADGRAYYAQLEAMAGDSDYLRIPLSNVPVLSSTDLAKYVSNKATFFAMSTGKTVGEGGHEFSAAAVSQVYGVALVCMPSVSDRDQDIVFSRSYNFSPVTKETGNELSMSMAQIFGENMLSSS